MTELDCSTIGRTNDQGRRQWGGRVPLHSVPPHLNKRVKRSRVLLFLLMFIYTEQSSTSNKGHYLAGVVSYGIFQ